MALPGSALYKDALNKNYELPKKYEDFSFHAYNTKPLPTEKLKPWEILKLRDDNFIKYHSNNDFLEKIHKKFGQKAKENIVSMTKIKLKRKIIEEAEKNSTNF